MTAQLDVAPADPHIMIPVPAGLPNPPEGLLVGKDVARMLFATHHEEKVQGVRLECKRVTANGALVQAFPQTLIPYEEANSPNAI